MEPQEYDEIIRQLVRTLAHQDTINGALRESTVQAWEQGVLPEGSRDLPESSRRGAPILRDRPLGRVLGRERVPKAYFSYSEVCMHMLEHELEDGRFQYLQVERRGDVALYTQTHKASGTIRYEVIKIRIQPEHTWPTGVTTSEKEAYPGSNAWGRDGWTFFALDAAQHKMGELLATAVEAAHGHPEPSHCWEPIRY